MKRLFFRPSLAWLRPEVFVYVSFFAFTLAFFVLNSYTGNGGQNILGYYVSVNGSQMAQGAAFFLVGAFLYIVVLWIKALMTRVDPLAILTRRNVALLSLRISVLSKNVGVVGIPFVLAFSTLTMALGPLNLFNATRLRDELLFRWDVLLTGTFPPLSLASLQYPGWFVSAMDVSFFYLVPVFVMFGAYLFLARQRLFRQAAGAFSLAGLILFAGWILFPVLSPHDRFIDNVYELPIFPGAQAYVEAYQPQEEVRAFLMNMRESKENLRVLPTSTFPSAHVAWAGLLVYYAYRLHRWLLIGALPLAVLSSLGTFFFAQHYFVDLPAGILVAAFSIWIVRWIAKKQET